ncbi:MAG: hypothetical protein AAGF12_43750, partial [Myxococcota bacterium]
GKPALPVSTTQPARGGLLLLAGLDAALISEGFPVDVRAEQRNAKKNHEANDDADCPNDDGPFYNGTRIRPKTHARSPPYGDQQIRELNPDGSTNF